MSSVKSTAYAPYIVPRSLWLWTCKVIITLMHTLCVIMYSFCQYPNTGNTLFYTVILNLDCWTQGSITHHRIPAHICYLHQVMLCFAGVGLFVFLFVSNIIQKKVINKFLGMASNDTRISWLQFQYQIQSIPYRPIACLSGGLHSPITFYFQICNSTKTPSHDSTRYTQQLLVIEGTKV